MHGLIALYRRVPLVLQIIVGLTVGILAAAIFPSHTSFFAIFGELFVKALKSVAPLLVLVLVTSAIASHKREVKVGLTYLFMLYVVSTLIAGTLAVFACFVTHIELPVDVQSIDTMAATGETIGIGQIILNLLKGAVSNPIQALVEANYIAILVWSVALGLTFRNASAATKGVLMDLATVVTDIVKIVIRFAPLGVMGLAYDSYASCASDEFGNLLVSYGQVLALLVAVILFVGFISNPIIVAIVTRSNPFPLVFTCMRFSASQAFFTRSSAANIPVNMELCDRMGVPRVMSSISIPLGSTVNMAGAAVTISVFTLTTVFGLGYSVSIPTAIMLCFVSALGACGTSGIAGGSLMLIPLACSLFNIPNDISMKVVAIGMILGVIQDSCETALNSSTDALLTIAVHRRNQRLNAIKAK